MAYCRFSSGDVYMLGTVRKHVIMCMSCGLTRKKSRSSVGWYDWYDTLEFHTRSAALRHLREHRKAGHKVTSGAFKRLWQERRERGDAPEWPLRK